MPKRKSPEPVQLVVSTVTPATVRTVSIRPWINVRSAPQPETSAACSVADRELRESIARQGILHPLIVRTIDPAGTIDDHTAFELICGYRRWGAAQALGIEFVPALVYPSSLSDGEAQLLQLTENLQRQDPDPFDTADAIERAHVQFGVPLAEIAARCGLVPSTIARRSRLASVPESVRTWHRKGAFSVTAVSEMLAIGDPDQMERCARELVQKYGWKEISTGNRPDAEISAAEVRAYVVANYVLDLSRAPWALDQAFESRPACVGCPNRLSNQPDLFGHHTAAGRDLCGDAKCFRDKCAVAFEDALAAARAAGVDVDADPKLAAPMTPLGHFTDSTWMHLDVQSQLCNGKTPRAALAARFRVRLASKTGQEFLAAVLRKFVERCKEISDARAVALVATPELGLPVFIVRERLLAAVLENEPDDDEPAEQPARAAPREPAVEPTPWLEIDTEAADECCSRWKNDSVAFRQGAGGSGINARSPAAAFLGTLLLGVTVEHASDVTLRLAAWRRNGNQSVFGALKPADWIHEWARRSADDGRWDDVFDLIVELASVELGQGVTRMHLDAAISRSTNASETLREQSRERRRSAARSGKKAKKKGRKSR